MIYFEFENFHLPNIHDRIIYSQKLNKRQVAVIMEQDVRIV